MNRINVRCVSKTLPRSNREAGEDRGFRVSAPVVKHLTDLSNQSPNQKPETRNQKPQTRPSSFEIAVQNFKIKIQYDGTDYHGWQLQANAQTIQGELTRVLSLFDEREVTVHGAGRTDAGVHAEGQVASFFLKRSFEPHLLRDAINGNLHR